MLNLLGIKRDAQISFHSLKEFKQQLNGAIGGGHLL